MKKYAYLIIIILSSFACSKSSYPEATQVQTEQECPKAKAMSPLEIGFAALLTIAVIISFTR